MESATQEDVNERRTQIGFIASLVLLTLVTSVVILAVRGFAGTTRWLAHSHEVVTELEGISASLAQADGAHRGYISSGDSTYLKERDSALTGLDEHLQLAKQLTADNSRQQLRLHELESSILQRRKQVDGLLGVVRNQGLAAAQRAALSEAVRKATLDVYAGIDQLK